MSEESGIWCLIGNIKNEINAGEGKSEVRHGTRLFRPGAKIYFLSLRRSWDLESGLKDDTDYDSRIIVLGQHRKSRKWIHCWIRTRYTENWRIAKTYKPRVKFLLKEFGWAGAELDVADEEIEKIKVSENSIPEFLEYIRSLKYPVKNNTSENITTESVENFETDINNLKTIFGKIKEMLTNTHKSKNPK